MKRWLPMLAAVALIACGPDNQPRATVILTPDDTSAAVILYRKCVVVKAEYAESYFVTCRVAGVSDDR